LQSYCKKEGAFFMAYSLESYELYMNCSLFCVQFSVCWNRRSFHTVCACNLSTNFVDETTKYFYI